MPGNLPSAALLAGSLALGLMLAACDRGASETARGDVAAPAGTDSAGVEPAPDEHAGHIAATTPGADHAGHVSAATPGAGHAGHAAPARAGADHAGHGAAPTPGAGHAGHAAPARTGTAAHAADHAHHGEDAVATEGLGALLAALLADPVVRARVDEDPQLSGPWNDPGSRERIAATPATATGMAGLLELVRLLTSDPVALARIRSDPALSELWSDEGVRRRVAGEAP